MTASSKMAAVISNHHVIICKMAAIISDYIYLKWLIFFQIRIICKMTAIISDYIYLKMADIISDYCSLVK